MSLDGVLESIVAGIAAGVPALKVCETIGGNVDLAEVQRRSRQLPAAFVFCIGTEDATLAQDKVKTTGLFAAVLVVKSEPSAPPVTMTRDAVVARLAGRIIYAVTTAGDWGDGEVIGPPSAVDSRNRYSTAADKAGAAIWAVSWRQQLELAADPAPAELDDLEKILATWELQDGTTPATDATDEITP